MTETSQDRQEARKTGQEKRPRTLRITLVRSPIGTTYRHKATLVALGLRHINQTVEQADTPQLRGHARQGGAPGDGGRAGRARRNDDEIA